MFAALFAAALCGQIQSHATRGRGDLAIPTFGPPHAHRQDPLYWVTPHQVRYPWLSRTGPAIPLQPPIPAADPRPFGPSPYFHKGLVPHQKVYRAPDGTIRPVP